ncbi:MAG: ABC transporter substrate-binding protein [Burkholderiaceae bacterium]|jgi:NitT/TauT family transport system substrate-binding protein|nr:ABC transporter substrate-binding protein [Burkholderiaceae bacterium]
MRFCRYLLPLAFILGITGVQAADQSAQERAKQNKIVVADAKSTHHLNLYVAKELGIFKKYGVDVEIINVKDPAAQRDSVVSGKADVFWACPTVAIAAIANGAPFQIISQVKKPCTSVLLVPKNSPIKTLSDLKGKRVAGLSPTCCAVISITSAARKIGVSFTLEKLPGGPAIAALEAGRVDAAILEEPHVSIAELKGFKVILPDISKNIPCRTIQATKGYLKANPEALKRFIQAIEESNAIILKDPKANRIVDIAVKYTGAPRDAILHGNDRLKFRTLIDEQGLSQFADDLVAQKVIKKNSGTDVFAPEFKGITWGK